MPKLDVYDFGGGGVNLVKNPLQLDVNELTSCQNAELFEDVSRGGSGALSKRGGLAVLTSALSGSILGICSLPLTTTFTKTLYASLGTASTPTWATSTNGTSWATATSPRRVTELSEATNEHFPIVTGYAFRIASNQRKIVYPGDDYNTSTGTPASNTALNMETWDGTNNIELLRTPIGPSAGGNHADGVTDMLVANGKIYLAILDPDNATNYKGRILSLSIDTGALSVIATPFGDSPYTTGGAPVCMAWYQGRLWVGLDQMNGNSDLGKVVWCYPDVDTAWTVDASTLKGYPTSLCEFGGDLYAGMRGNATYGSILAKRSSSAGTWANSDTNAGTNYGYYSLISYNSALYAVHSFQTAADTQVIRKFNGSSWSTDRDVKASDWTTQTNPPRVGMAYVWGSDLYYAFCSTTESSSEGFILRLSGGTWTKVYTGNINGRITELVVRS